MSDSPFAPLGVFEEQVVVAVLRTPADACGMQVRGEIEHVAGRDRSRRRFAVSAARAMALAGTRAMRERLWHDVDVGAMIARAED